MSREGGRHRGSIDRARTMPAAFAVALERNPSGGIVYFGRHYHFGELNELVEAYAAGLARHDLSPGDRVIIQLQNNLQFVLSALASWRLGAIIVPVSPMYGAGELSKIITDSGATAWVTSGAIWNEIGAETVTNSELEIVVTTSLTDFAGDVPHEFAGDVSPSCDKTLELARMIEKFSGMIAPSIEVRPEHVAAIIYTSGTTGIPKGSVNTHSSLAWAGEAFPEAIAKGFETDAVCLALAPLVHITGLAMHVSAWLMSASTLVLGYRFNPDYYLHLIERHRVTWSVGAATAFIALIQRQRANPRDLSSLERLGCGGAPIPPRLVGEIREVLGVSVSPGYGLTETTGAITMTPSGSEARTESGSGVVSAGPVVGDSEVSIRDEGGEELPMGQAGEVCVKGMGVIAEYWQNREATAEATRNGWFRTGDIGFLDTHRWLYIVDRTKNMIIASGYKVWPREIEDTVYQLPAVREVAVFGVPDKYRGETVKVVLSTRPGHSINPDDVITHCRANLAAYKVPRLVEVMDELPKNPNGKILHRVLRDREMAKSSGVVSPR